MDWSCCAASLAMASAAATMPCETMFSSVAVMISLSGCFYPIAIYAYLTSKLEGAGRV